MEEIGLSTNFSVLHQMGIYMYMIFFFLIPFFFLLGGREASKSVLESMEISIC